jgi:hypothetical protein
MVNENAIANILVDVNFLEEQFRNVGRANLVSLFAELRSVRHVAVSFDLSICLSLTLRRQHQSCY